MFGLGNFGINHPLEFRKCPPKNTITSTSLQTSAHVGYNTEDDCTSIERLILVLDISI